MSFGRPCEVCRRSIRIGGELLEVCWSDLRGAFTCLACHFTPPPKGGTVLAGGENKELYWQTMVTGANNE
jgi:hypothetical protein